MWHISNDAPKNEWKLEGELVGYQEAIAHFVIPFLCADKAPVQKKQKISKAYKQ